MKLWRLIVTDVATWHGHAEEYQLRWQAELAYADKCRPGVIVTLAEFKNGQQIEIVRDSRFETQERKA